MKTATLKLLDIVSGTSSNDAGYSLFINISKYFDEGNKVKLSLENSSPMSSSFLNSSFGELYDKYGIDFIKENLSLINYLPNQASVIKKYLETLSVYH